MTYTLTEVRGPVGIVMDRTIDPGRVFDLTLPLDEAAKGYRAMDQRTATKVLLTL